MSSVGASPAAAIRSAISDCYTQLHIIARNSLLTVGYIISVEKKQQNVLLRVVTKGSQWRGQLISWSHLFNSSSASPTLFFYHHHTPFLIRSFALSLSCPCCPPMQPSTTWAPPSICWVISDCHQYLDSVEGFIVPLMLFKHKISLKSQAPKTFWRDLIITFHLLKANKQLFIHSSLIVSTHWIKNGVVCWRDLISCAYWLVSWLSFTAAS